MRETHRTIMAVLVLFYSNNKIQLHHKEDPDKQRESLRTFDLVAGLQADIIESDTVTPLIESVGDPKEIFVHAGSLSRLLGCTPQTARNRLKELEDANLIREHGNISADVGNVVLYRPVLDDASEYLKTVDELVGNSDTESGELIEVVPTDFKHLGDGRWQYIEDSQIVIDVSDIKGKSNRQYIREQLREHELTPTSMNNFQYQLRLKSGIINS